MGINFDSELNDAPIDEPIVGFMTTADTAYEYFKRCIEREAVTETERMAIFRELEDENKAVPLTMDDLKAEAKGKKILSISRKTKKRGS